MSNNLEGRRVLFLIAILALVGFAVGGSTLWILYETSLVQTRMRLAETVQSRARLIEAIAQQKMIQLRQYHLPDDPEQILVQTLLLLRQAQEEFPGLGETGEFVLGRREGDQLVFLLHRRHDRGDEPIPVPYDSELAVPMRLAVEGHSGSIIGADYRNEIVLAAHEPLKRLNVGIVAKIDMAEIRQPYLKAGGIALLVGLLVIFTGGWFFLRISEPMLRQIQETELLKENQRLLDSARQALQEKAVYLDNILRTATDMAIVATDLNYIIKYFNPTAEAFYSLFATTAIGRPLQAIHRERNVDPDRFQSGMDAVRERGEHRYEVRDTREGRERIIESRVSAITDTFGVIVGYVLMARDVTTARKDQEEARRAARRYRMLFETANDAILVAHAETGLIVEANQMAATLLQRPLHEIIGQHQTQLHPPEERDRYAELFREHVQGGRDTVENVHVVRPDGSRVPVDIRAAVTDLGDMPVILGIFRDVTQREQAEEALQNINHELESRVLQRTRELERSNRDLQQFAYVASHDLQEPLRLVTGYVQLLEKRYSGALDEKATKYIAYVVDGVRYMSDLINSLLAYSRLETQGDTFTTFEGEKALHRALHFQSRVIASTQASVSQDPLPTITGDESQMVQLFQNLLANALKFRGESPPLIHIGCRQDGDCWHFTVRDNGIGIEPQYLERIFTIFQKLHARSRYEGTGIGLALCKRIVERHGGQIWAESTLGEGSTFHFTLPTRPGTLHS
ncbi:MAG: PAS domain S-box protein [Magnetococcales bacterium]|nr:PAS domain S-box protein [Magnetococcales bacterium]